MKRAAIATAILALVGSAGVALAFTDSQIAGLTAHGYHKVNDWTYAKTAGSCTTTVQDGGSNRFYVYDNKGTSLWPVKGSQLANGAKLIEDNCSAVN